MILLAFVILITLQDKLQQITRQITQQQTWLCVRFRISFFISVWVQILCILSHFSPFSLCFPAYMLSTSSCVSVRSQNRILILYLCSQNILEMKVYDENAVTKDDLLFTVLFDVAKVQLGETVHLTFHLNRKVSDKTALVIGRKFFFDITS